MFAVLFGEVLKYWIENLSIVWNGKDLKIEFIPYVIVMLRKNTTKAWCFMLIASCNVNIFMILRSFTIIVECIWCGRSINYLNVYAMYFIGMLLQLQSLHFLAKNRINNAQDYVACNKARVHNISILFPWCSYS